MGTPAVKKRAERRRRIIERPRLIRLLDASAARIRMLVAPAGYGKTTLARQWLTAGNRRHAWFACRASSADVAALTEGLVTAMRTVLPGYGGVVLERFAAMGRPAHEVDVVAELMIEELDEWPSDAWLVVDDCHLIAQAPSAELLVGELASSGRLNLLILSRARPAWASARRVVYGEILDLGRGALAMTDSEAAELLAGASRPDGLDGLRGSGWPALLGLAALAGERIDHDALPGTVYDFLAEELFAGLSRDAQQAVLAIVPMPRMDHEIATELLGTATDTLLAEAAAAGMVESIDGGAAIEMHPLIRDFLLTKRDSGRPERSEQLFRILVARRRWDDAFSVVQEFFPEGLEELLHDAVPELLAKSRIQTLEAWLRFADDVGATGAAYEHAAAELSFRDGAHLEALAAAQALARRLPDDAELKTRVLLLAGRAAHLASLEQEALDAYRACKDIAQTEATRRMALWGEISAAIDLELPVAEKLLADAEGHCDTPADVVTHAIQKLLLESRSGGIRSLERAHALVSTSRRVDDPLQRCSFLSILGSTLAIGGRYEDASEIAEMLLVEARRNRLEFVVSYALATRAMAHAGLRDAPAALAALDDAAAAAKKQQDKHAVLNCEAIRSRTLFAKGLFAPAHEALATDVVGAIPSMAAEVHATRALALAGMESYDEARRLARQAADTSSSTEVRVLVPAVEAICALRLEPLAAPGAVGSLVGASAESGNVDALLTVLRGVPDLLAHAPREAIESVAATARRVDDGQLEEIAQALRGNRRAENDLSPRELEVARLLAMGLSNNQIGARLFISPATAKVHVRHIFEKLGVRTRVEAAVKLSARLDEPRLGSDAPE